MWFVVWKRESKALVFFFWLKKYICQAIYTHLHLLHVYLIYVLVIFYKTAKEVWLTTFSSQLISNLISSKNGLKLSLMLLFSYC